MRSERRYGAICLLFGPGNFAFAAGVVLMTWPLLAAWSVWRRLNRR